MSNSPDDLSQRKIEISVEAIRLIFTNYVGSNIVCYFPTGNNNTDTLVIPPGVSCICLCPLGPVELPYYIDPYELIVQDPDIVIKEVGHYGFYHQLTYYNLISKTQAPSLLTLTSNFLREHLSAMRNLDPIKLGEEGFPRTLINSLCDVDTHIIPESYKHRIVSYRPGRPPLDLSMTPWKCGCRDRRWHCWNSWSYEIHNVTRTHK
jgi:hypothetical protein